MIDPQMRTSSETRIVKNSAARIPSDKSPMATQGLYSVNVTAFFQVAFQVSAAGQSLVPNGQWVDFATYGLPTLQANVA